MKSRYLSSVRILSGFIVSMIFLSSILSETSCNNTKKNESEAYKDSVRHWLNWNVFFGTTTTDVSRANTKKSIEDSLRAYANKIDPSVTIQFRWSSCPCDTLLTNLDATLVGGSGDLVATPPTNPQPGASGDYIVGNNIRIEIPEALHENHFDSTKKIRLKDLSVNGQAILDGHVVAFIDTGLDTTVFQPSIGNLLWKASNGPTLFNFLKPDGLDNLSDSNNVKHGTAVAALAMLELKNAPKSKIMALKAFDKNGKGTIYSVSCALSYAIQNKATLINTSWGYYGAPDSVLYYYIKRADSLSIPIITAAGNSAEPHPLPICRNDINAGNKLENDHLFYPACFSASLQSLITVTGLSENSVSRQFVPCYYQNYSDNFVSVGVLNKQNCCQYSVGFLPAAPIEGTSFATPIVSGRYLLRLQTLAPASRSARSVVDMFSIKTPGLTFTHNGSYIEYAP